MVKVAYDPVENKVVYYDDVNKVVADGCCDDCEEFFECPPCAPEVMQDIQLVYRIKFTGGDCLPFYDYLNVIATDHDVEAGLVVSGTVVLEPFSTSVVSSTCTWKGYIEVEHGTLTMHDDGSGGSSADCNDDTSIQVRRGKFDFYCNDESNVKDAIYPLIRIAFLYIVKYGGGGGPSTTITVWHEADDFYDAFSGPPNALEPGNFSVPWVCWWVFPESMLLPWLTQTIDYEELGVPCVEDIFEQLNVVQGENYGTDQWLAINMYKTIGSPLVAESSYTGLAEDSYIQLFSDIDCDTAIPWSQPGSGDTSGAPGVYFRGDIVTHDSRCWICTKDLTSEEPSDSAEDWALVN